MAGCGSLSLETRLVVRVWGHVMAAPCPWNRRPPPLLTRMCTDPLSHQKGVFQFGGRIFAICAVSSIVSCHNISVSSFCQKEDTNQDKHYALGGNTNTHPFGEHMGHRDYHNTDPTPTQGPFLSWATLARVAGSKGLAGGRTIGDPIA